MPIFKIFFMKRMNQNRLVLNFEALVMAFILAFILEL